MKKLLLLLSMLLVMCSIFAVCVFADAEGTVSGQHTDWKYISSTRTLYVYSSYEGGHNETGRYGDEGAWGAYKDEIEHVVILGKINRVTYNAFQDHTALKSVVSTVSSYNTYAFFGCTNLVRFNSDVDGVANIKGEIRNGAFRNTGLTTVRFTDNSSTLVADAYGNCDPFQAGATVYATVGTTIYNSLVNFNVKNVVADATYTVKVVLDGTTHTITYKKGESLTFPTVNGKLVALFSDSACTVPYTKDACENVTLYAKTVMELVGTEVRCADYQGLRSVYKMDENYVLASSGYEIYEFGALSRAQDLLDTDLEYDMRTAKKFKVYVDGAITGSVLTIPSGGITDFAATITGQSSVEDAEADYLFRGYVIFRNKSTQETFVRYTGVREQSLANAADATYKVAVSEGLLSSDELSFVKTMLDKGATPHYMYTKGELKTALTNIYNSSTYAPGEYLSGADVGAWLLKAYLTTGEYPAIIALDFKDGGLTDKEIVALQEYVENGGMVTYSYHMICPCPADHGEGYTGTKVTNWCSGTCTAANWQALYTEGTDYNARLKNILEIAVDNLQKLEDAGIPVLWRPYHEHTGSAWFWWCIGGRNISADHFVNLWKYTYNYMENTKGLDNLVWVIAPSPASGNGAALGYPGNAYVDVVGVDWYGTAYSSAIKDSHDALRNVAGDDAIFALTEFGCNGAEGFTCTEQNALMKTTMNNGVKIAYTINWSGNSGMFATGNAKEYMADATTLGLAEVKAYFNAIYQDR